MASARAKKKPGKKPAKKTTPKKKTAARAAPKRAVKAKKAVAAKKAKPAPTKKAAPAPAKKKQAGPKLDARVKQALATAEIEGLIQRLPPPLQPVVRSLRQLVLDAAPEAKELLEGDSAAYAANGIFARIEPSERAVLVRFLRGGRLPSASELEGEGDERALSLSSPDALRATVLQKLVREAVMLNLAEREAAV